MKLIAALHPTTYLVTLFVSILLVFGGCSTSDRTSSAFKPGQAQFDTTPFSIANIHSEPALQSRVLAMSFGEAVARLGSLQFNAEASFSFTQNEETIEQSNQYTASEDSLGNFHVRFQTPHSSIEAYQVGADFYIRHGKGNLRKKPRRDMSSEKWGQQLFSSLNQTLQVFRPQLELSKGVPSQHLGRKTLQVKLDLNPHVNARSIDASELPTPQLPIPIPSQWRELAKPLSISGTLWIDEKTGVVVRSQIAGKVEISDQEVQPTQLALHYESSITDIGKVRPIQAPKSIEEHRRAKPPRNLLSFMRKYLPKTQPQQNEPEVKTP